MADIDITQAEADSLIAMEKFRVDEQRLAFPGARGKVVHSFSVCCEPGYALLIERKFRKADYTNSDAISPTHSRMGSHLLGAKDRHRIRQGTGFLAIQNIRHS